MLEDSLEDYMDEETARLLERYKRQSDTGNVGFYDVDEYVEIIDAYIWSGDLNKATEVLTLAQGQYPEAVELKLKNAEICLEMNFLERSLQLLAEVEQVEPYLYDSYIVKGHTLLCMRRFEDARKSFRMAADKGADQVDVDMGLAQVEIEAGDSDKAWMYMQRIIGYDNDTVETCNRFIDMAQKGNKLPEAMEWVRSLLKEHPYSLLYWKMLVELADAAGCYEQALEACEYALAIAPDDLETLKNKFNLLENVDTEGSRLSFYLHMEKIATESGDETFLAAVMLRVAQEYELKASWEEAEDYYHRLTDVPDIRQYALFRLGVIADFRRSYRSSLAFFNQALQERMAGEEEHVNRAKIYRGMARTCFNMGNAGEGLRYGRMACEEDQDNRFHLYAYVADCLDQEKDREVQGYIDERLSAGKKTEGLLLAKAVVAYYRGGREEACSLFTQAFMADARTMRDLADLFPGILSEDSRINELLTSSMAAGLGFMMPFDPEDGEPLFYYGPDVQE